MDMKFLLQWVFASLGSLISVLLAQATRELQMVRKSVENLNVNVAVVVQRVDSHETRIAKLEVTEE